jgi:DNA-binding MarR family transcriptional regulator
MFSMGGKTNCRCRSVNYKPGDHIMNLVKLFVSTSTNQKLKLSDFTLRQLAAISVIAASDGKFSVRHIAEKIGVSKPAVTRAIDKFVKLGYATRPQDPMDRRSVLVQLTPAGRRVVDGLQRVVEAA